MYQTTVQILLFIILAFLIGLSVLLMKAYQRLGGQMVEGNPPMPPMGGDVLNYIKISMIISIGLCILTVFGIILTFNVGGKGYRIGGSRARSKSRSRSRSRRSRSRSRR